jgi:ABC-type multidrug transport system fused ATPase/permease subunit
MLPRHCRELTFEGVHFGYSSQQQVLRGIDLAIPFGQTLAIVGPNGCGKTTLANLIPRFFDPKQGCVRLDGIDLRQVRCRDLRRQIGLVTQEPLLFDDTVYNNIRHGAPGANHDLVMPIGSSWNNSKKAMRRSSDKAGFAFPGDSDSGSPWHGPFSATRRS